VLRIREGNRWVKAAGDVVSLITTAQTFIRGGSARSRARAMNLALCFVEQEASGVAICTGIVGSRRSGSVLTRGKRHNLIACGLSGMLDVCICMYTC
jgi:hypothetical protein